MTALLDVRDGLAARLDTISGFQAYTRITAFNLPCALVLPPTSDYRGDLGLGSYIARFDVPVFVASSAEEPLDNLLVHLDPANARSVFAAIEADPTLGGLDVTTLAVSAGRMLNEVEFALYRAYGQFVQIEVHVTHG